jgi:hypothetical protein
MPTTRELKNFYESRLEHQISDATFYRVIASIKACGEPVNKESLSYYASLKKANSHLPIDLDEYRKIIELAKSVKEGKEDYTGSEFKRFIQARIPFTIPKSSLYRFFLKAGLSFGYNKRYQNKLLVPVLVNACVWSLKKQRKQTAEIN